LVTRVLPSCVSPKVPLPNDFVADLDPVEPNLPYPGRPEPMLPPSNPGPGVSDDDPPAVPRTGTRTANSGDDEGCSVGSTRGVSPLGALLVVLGLGLRRRRRRA
jgi:MYXO-CTERM domain-containing protein